MGCKCLSPTTALKNLLEEARNLSGGSLSRLSQNVDLRIGTVSLWYKGVWPSLVAIRKVEEFVKQHHLAGKRKKKYKVCSPESVDNSRYFQQSLFED